MNAFEFLRTLDCLGDVLAVLMAGSSSCLVSHGHVPRLLPAGMALGFLVGEERSGGATCLSVTRGEGWLGGEEEKAAGLSFGGRPLAGMGNKL